MHPSQTCTTAACCSLSGTARRRGCGRMRCELSREQGQALAARQQAALPKGVGSKLKLNKLLFYSSSIPFAMPTCIPPLPVVWSSPVLSKPAFECDAQRAAGTPLRIQHSRLLYTCCHSRCRMVSVASTNVKGKRRGFKVHSIARQPLCCVDACRWMSSGSSVDRAPGGRDNNGS